MVVLARLFLVVTILGAIFGGPNQVLCGPIFDHVMKTGTLRLGLPYNRPPWGFLTSAGEWVGFEVDLAEEMSKHMNCRLEKLKVTDASWGSTLGSGRVDAALCRISRRRSLSRDFDFSIPYFFDALQVLAIKGSFNTAADIKGKKIAVVKGASHEKTAIALLKQDGNEPADKNVVFCPGAPTCFLEVGQEHVAGWLDSGMTLFEYSSQSPGRFERITVSGVVGEVAAALKKDDSALRNNINFAIQDMVDDGSFMKIYDKWFGPATHYSFPLIRGIDMWKQ